MIVFLGNLGMGGGGAAPPPVVRSFHKALVAKLLTIDDVTDVIGHHVYPGVVPQQHDLDRDGPAVTYTVTKDSHMGHGGGTDHHLRGSDGTEIVRVQISGWSYVFADADAIAEALYAALDGTWGVVWGDGLVIASCIREQAIDLPEAPTESRPRAIYQIASEFHVRYRTAAAVRN